MEYNIVKIKVKSGKNNWTEEIKVPAGINQTEFINNMFTEFNDEEVQRHESDSSYPLKKKVMQNE